MAHCNGEDFGGSWLQSEEIRSLNKGSLLTFFPLSAHFLHALAPFAHTEIFFCVVTKDDCGQL